MMVTTVAPTGKQWADLPTTFCYNHRSLDDTPMKAIVVLGNSGAGKDYFFQNSPYTVNRKFSQFAKDFVDSIYGGNFEEDRHTFEVSPGKTKNDILIALFHFWQEHDPEASVRFAKNNWEHQDREVFTDVRTVAEVEYICGRFDEITLVYLTGGNQKSSDNPQLMGARFSELNADLLELTSAKAEDVLQYMNVNDLF